MVPSRGQHSDVVATTSQLNGPISTHVYVGSVQGQC